MNDACDDILKVLGASNRVLITTHVRPDGDALGSTAAMALALRSRGVEAHVLLLSKLPGKYAFVYADAGIEWSDVDAGFPSDFTLAGYDTLLTIDTGTWSQLPGLRPFVEAFGGRKLVIDHHLTQENWADVKLVQTTAAAAGEIVAGVLERWAVPIDRKIASALYVALVSDTGWFQYSNTTPHTLRLAAQLVEAGVDTDGIYQRLYQNERPQRLRMQAIAMQSLQMPANGQVAVMSIRLSDLKAADATANDTEGLINLPLQVRDVCVSVLLTESENDQPVRVSFRSKGQLDCAKFAERYGGGGHARAAGAKIEGVIDDVQQRLIVDLTAALV